jgi:hypothetical protein
MDVDSNNDIDQHFMITSFPISTVIVYLYRFIKSHPVYSSDLEFYENRVLEFLKKFYFKLKKFF